MQNPPSPEYIVYRKSRNTGRPKDPGLESRVYACVLDHYAKNGLNALSFSSVARDASVGKAALYARWASVEDLLIDALESVTELPEQVMTGSARDEMLSVAISLWRHYASTLGMISVRINLDAGSSPRLRQPYRKFVSGYRSVLIAVVRRGQEAGQIDRAVDPIVAIDMIVGAVMLHAMFTPSRPGISAEDADSLVANIVDTAFGGLANS
ncbi:TetR/AcrR family transcriptional regulator [Tsukamurella asaccharolytica]|nr:TetR/AcrR family transcriptional regulator [Tsukamurella asaccharolytica]